MHDAKYAEKRFGNAAAFGPLVLPYVQDENRRIVYTITEYDPLLDSSNMGIPEWTRIAADIKVRSKHSRGVEREKLRNCLFLAAIVRVLRWFLDFARDRHAFVHRVGPVIHAGEFGQNGHHHWFTDPDIRDTHRRQR